MLILCAGCEKPFRQPFNYYGFAGGMFSFFPSLHLSQSEFFQTILSVICAVPMESSVPIPTPMLADILTLTLWYHANHLRRRRKFQHYQIWSLHRRRKYLGQVSPRWNNGSSPWTRDSNSWKAGSLIWRRSSRRTWRECSGNYRKSCSRSSTRCSCECWRRRPAE